MGNTKYIAFTVTILLQFLAINGESIPYGGACTQKNYSAENYSPEPSSLHWDFGFIGQQDSNFCDFENAECINNICQCESPAMMVFSERLCQCGAPTDSYCSDQIPCLQGNICENNMCVCPLPSVPLADGSCSAGYNELCESDSQCTPGLFLSCIEGSCFCKGTRQSVYEWDSATDSEGCKIRAGESCFPGSQPCVSNSLCSQMGQKFSCECETGYLPSPGGFCQKGYDQPCTLGFHECSENRGLTCTNSTCQCTDNDSFFDQTKQSCVTFVGQSCGNVGILFGEKYEVSCVENAECISSNVFPSNPRRVCQCQPGFIPEEIEGKTCVLPKPMKEIVQ